MTTLQTGRQVIQQNQQLASSVSRLTAPLLGVSLLGGGFAGTLKNVAGASGSSANAIGGLTASFGELGRPLNRALDGLRDWIDLLPGWASGLVNVGFAIGGVAAAIKVLGLGSLAASALRALGLLRGIPAAAAAAKAATVGLGAAGAAGAGAKGAAAAGAAGAAGLGAKGAATGGAVAAGAAGVPFGVAVAGGTAAGIGQGLTALSAIENVQQGNRFAAASDITNFALGSLSLGGALSNFGREGLNLLTGGGPRDSLRGIFSTITGGAVGAAPPQPTTVNNYYGSTGQGQIDNALQSPENQRRLNGG